jgi:hypothetical protein
MKTRTINIYEFSELSDKAKQHAKELPAFQEFTWADECLSSLKALAEHFKGELKDWQIDWHNSSYSSVEFEMPDLEQMPADEIAGKLAKLGTFDPVTLRGNGDCLLTGYCADESAIDGFRQAWHKGERDLNTLMQSAFKNWLKDCQADALGFFDDENFAEHCEANQYEFLENGDLA